MRAADAGAGAGEGSPRRLLSRIGSRAPRPGSRRALGALAAIVAAAAGGSAAGVLSSEPGAHVAPARYGGIPSWLPQAKLPVGRVVQASAAHPWLAIEGDTVAVALAHGRVRATAVGPTVPEEGRFPVPASSPCTFTVSFASASGTVPLRDRDFSVRDELGRLHRKLAVAALGGGAIPRSVSPGRAVSITVHAVLPTGGGRLRWAPQGARPIVSWDFDVEID